ncbi:crossover junction endodeoxyribonuclease RusA [Caldanaerobius fijiensis DSM 17918]|uniref:Crossover junction endodeoxyribonuclease RusA n=1 Tax=Caldanaerobius fijiensis DSM 17918 TaxID=1121256 RepID=A0A1M5BLW2_9THEO|nr:RusA family crossover junction endodeoxyribonuclease [Caldanaerobius fijiensis]SHF43514.1 crossover junction endodeoxyribonuclease RusA [Caldanaerobius fijiensis DSM 17918]
MYRIVVKGHPVPKGRPRFSRFGRIYTPRRTKEYEEYIGWIARSIIKSPIKGKVGMHLDIYMKGSADIDNIAKAVADSLNGIAYIDDRQIVHLETKRMPCASSEDERVEITLWEEDNIKKAEGDGER